MENNIYMLIQGNGVYSVCHTKGLTKQEADEMRKRHAELFPSLDYSVQQQDEENEPRHYNENACDGWEDIYNYD